MVDPIERFLFWLAVTAVSIDAYFYFFHAGIPNIRTAPAIRKKIIDLLKQDCASRNINNYTVVDLGSGNGLFTREIAKAMPQAKVIGIEISRQSVWWANWQKRQQKIDNLEYRQMSFYDYEFAQADAVVMFLIPPVLTALGKKLNSEARQGTYITSNKFRLGDGWEPLETLRIKTLYLHQGKLHIYRKT